MKCDVLVFDSTPSGVLAAVAAARAGADAVLLTEDRHVGGMQTSGLGWTNAGQRAIVGGLAREFHDRVLGHYVDAFGADSPQAQACSQGFRFEPHVAEAVFEAMLAEAGVRVLREQWITAIERDGARLRALTTNLPMTIAARIFVDASYEGDLLAAAGCDYHLGRESASVYGESLAGIRLGDRTGDGDDRLQPFDYRLCLTNDPRLRVDVPTPPRIDRRDYAWLIQRLTDKPPTRLHQALPLNPMPNNKTDSRTAEWVGGSWSYVQADRDTRRRIAAAHRDYSAGYFHLLLDGGLLDSSLRDELAGYGLAGDEFTDNANWPWHIYVREARRLVGRWVLTQQDVTRRRFFDDSVALGSFFLDVHTIQVLPDGQGRLVGEGSLGGWAVRPYEIPYRCLLPRAGQADNLLVTVCVSASHVAFSTLRMEPVYAMLGHAAGTAAAMAARAGCDVADVAASELQQRLADQHAVLSAEPFSEYWPPNRQRAQ